MLVYCTGISQPANGTIFAPYRMCASYSGVFFCAASLTGQTTRRCDHAQRWIGFSEADEVIALGTTRSTLHANCTTLPCASNDLAGQTRTPFWFSGHSGADPDRDWLHRAGLCAGLSQPRLRIISNTRFSFDSSRPGLAPCHLQLHSADVQSAVAASRALVSLVHRRRSRTRLGIVPTDALFLRRNDWHDHRRILFRQQFLQWHAHHVIILRIRAVLSRGSYLHPFYSACKNQMAGMDLCRVFDARIFSWIELVSCSSHCRVH